MHTALIGASRGIGRAAALQSLLNPFNSVSLLLRNPSVIEADLDFQTAIKEGRVRIIKGDANNQDDLKELLDYNVDAVVFTLGAVYPDGNRQFSWSKGFILPSPDVCTSAILRLVRVMSSLAEQGRPTPALVTISVVGVGKSARSLPFMYKLILPWLLQQTIADKKGVETVLSHASANLSPDQDDPPTHILPPTDLDKISKGFLKEVLVVRPAQLKDTDGSMVLRAGEDVSTYSTGRVELGRWIAAALDSKGEWMNRRITVGA